MKTATRLRQSDHESRRLADLRAAVVAAVRRCRQRVDEMIPLALSPFDAEILAAVADLDDEIDRAFDLTHNS